MWFPAALISSTLITIISIVAVYKIFLDHPEITQQTRQQATLLPSPTPAVEPSPISSPSASTPLSQSNLSTPTPKPSKTPAIIVLSNNTTSSPSYSSLTTSTPTGSGTISGTINLSGTIPSGTSVVVVAREHSTNNPYQVIVSGIAASDDAAWSWKSAKHTTVYDMIAILKGSSGGVNTDYADSQMYVVTAPALNQIFDINAGYSMNAPSGSITTTCTNKTSGNTWTVSVNFPSVTGAQSYWLQIGTTSGAADLSQVKQNASSGDNQVVNTTFTDSILYYARYAVASVTNANDVQYSPFSAEQTVKCP